MSSDCSTHPKRVNNDTSRTLHRHCNDTAISIVLVRLKRLLDERLLNVQSCSSDHLTNVYPTWISVQASSTPTRTHSAKTAALTLAPTYSRPSKHHRSSQEDGDSFHFTFVTNKDLTATKAILSLCLFNGFTLADQLNLVGFTADQRSTVQH